MIIRIFLKQYNLNFFFFANVYYILMLPKFYSYRQIMYYKNSKRIVNIWSLPKQKDRSLKCGNTEYNIHLTNLSDKLESIYNVYLLETNNIQTIHRGEIIHFLFGSFHQQ
jgi:hypothetical protein